MTDEYIRNFTSYELIGIIDEFNSEKEQLTEINQSIDFALEQLQEN
jgi:hypothetical protein